MDDLLLFTPNKQMHFEKLIDLLRALCKKWLENFSEEMSVVQDRVAVYGEYHLHQGQESMCETIAK